MDKQDRDKMIEEIVEQDMNTASPATLRHWAEAFLRGLFDAVSDESLQEEYEVRFK